jgi:hypothetical protein
MDYAKHYERLIARARGRALTGYSERHHILPRCLSGDDSPSNLVDLTPEEHYVAHQLLVKMHPRNGRLVHAAVLMSTRCSGNKAYGWLRRRHSQQIARNLVGNQHTLGYRHTDEAKRKISERHLGARRPDSTREKLRQAAIGNTRGLGKKLPEFTAEHREKLSAAKRGRTLSPEHCAAIAEAHRGKKSPGRKLSEEHKIKLADLHRGRKRSAETKERIAAGQRARWERKKGAGG